MSASDVVAGVHITRVVEALGGTVRHGRCQAFWRKGDGWNVKLNDDIGAWCDHARHEGGGVLDLVQKVRGCSRAEAFHWVADLRGIALNATSWSPRRRRHFAAQKGHAEIIARECAWWARASMIALESAKAEAFERGDITALAWAARELYLFQRAVPSTILARFVKARQESPDEVEALIQEGREDEEYSGVIAATIVIMLAKSSEDKLCVSPVTSLQA